jgi:hypothetical protein
MESFHHRISSFFLFISLTITLSICLNIITHLLSFLSDSSFLTIPCKLGCTAFLSSQALLPFFALSN